ncbi:RraA family protein [Xanthobacter dioxanivorans]|uniref:Putative 4-hydroxy-4-methyl-2-oxoglutarate aldolase n=1 Tax=Xanthobacter dioxanivorans TaxID=2528964 RepID=A0A974PLN6_9HYPH|nr:RraA family protein [Xanthobacter dioxanivorans]QRG05556.1 RraA family protein [Xanthobacter dioxanivorans]
MYDAQTIALFKDVSTTALSDALDAVTSRKLFISHKVRRLAGSRMVGPAVTLMTAATAERAPHNVGIKLLDTTAPGSVIVAQLEDETDAALWGAPEIAVAIRRGLAGFVGDGAVRSVSQAAGSDFGIFATNVTPAGGFGRLKTMFSDQPIECGGIEINPGDLIVGDDDGVIAVPRKLVPDIAATVRHYEGRQARMIAACRALGSIKEALALHGTVEVQR